jgi:hypothetical protein
MRGVLVGSDLGGGHAELQAVAEAVAKKNKALRIAKGERAQEYAVDYREDGRCGSDAQRQGEDDGEGKAGRFPELADC